MEYLKIHTDEEFERMSDEDYAKYENALVDTTSDLGFRCSTLTEMEEELLGLVEDIKNPKKKLGSKYKSISQEKKKLIDSAKRPIEKCRKAIIDILQSYIGNGELRFTKTVKTVGRFDESFHFNVIRMQAFVDPFTESYEEYFLSCEMLDDFDGEFVRLNRLPLGTLLDIVKLIQDDKAVLYSNRDSVLYYRSIEELKTILLASGLLEGGIL